MKKLIFLLPVILIVLSSVTQTDKKPSLKKANKVLSNFCAFIPSGNALVENDTLSVSSFYMSKTEITNFQYLEFLWHLKESGDEEAYRIAVVDSLKWRTVGIHSGFDTMLEYYHKHPAYRDYPVVNISREAAELYCEWLSAMYDSISGGELQLKFRIPTRAEWIRAARGDRHRATYSWKGPFVMNENGLLQANFIRNGAECIRRNPETGKLEYISTNYYFEEPDNLSSFVIAPAESYWPNQFGLFNMNGNVSEMISDGDFVVGGDWLSPGYDIRNESIRDFKEPSPTSGFRVVATFMEKKE